MLHTADIVPILALFVTVLTLIAAVWSVAGLACWLWYWPQNAKHWSAGENILAAAITLTIIVVSSTLWVMTAMLIHAL